MSLSERLGILNCLCFRTMATVLKQKQLSVLNLSLLRKVESGELFFSYFNSEQDMEHVAECNMLPFKYSKVYLKQAKKSKLV